MMMTTIESYTRSQTKVHYADAKGGNLLLGTKTAYIQPLIYRGGYSLQGILYKESYLDQTCDNYDFKYWFLWERYHNKKL